MLRLAAADSRDLGLPPGDPLGCLVQEAHGRLAPDRAVGEAGGAVSDQVGDAAGKVGVGPGHRVDHVEGAEAAEEAAARIGIGAAQGLRHQGGGLGAERPPARRVRPIRDLTDTDDDRDARGVAHVAAPISITASAA